MGFISKLFGDKSKMTTDIAYWEKRAREGIIVSSSMKEHFEVVARSMNAIGAVRHGSTSGNAPDGTELIVDEYDLPSGNPLRAGYAPNDEADAKYSRSLA